MKKRPIAIIAGAVMLIAAAALTAIALRPRDNPRLPSPHRTNAYPGAEPYVSPTAPPPH